MIAGSGMVTVLVDLVFERFLKNRVDFVQFVEVHLDEAISP